MPSAIAERTKKPSIVTTAKEFGSTDPQQAYEINLKIVPDDARVSLKGVLQLVIDAASLEDPKAKTLAQQLMDLSFLPSF